MLKMLLFSYHCLAMMVFIDNQVLGCQSTAGAYSNPSTSQENPRRP